MTKPTTGEQQSTDQANEAMSLSKAVRIIKEAIAAEENRLRQFIGSEEDDDPVMLEGETTTGFVVHILVEPSRVVQTLLNYDYPIYKVLRENPPQRMWDELARITGLDNVESVDL